MISIWLVVINLVNLVNLVYLVNLVNQVNHNFSDFPPERGMAKQDAYKLRTLIPNIKYTVLMSKSQCKHCFYKRLNTNFTKIGLAKLVTIKLEQIHTL